MLEGLVTKGQKYVQCNQQRLVSISNLAPDVSLSALNKDILDEREIQLIKLIGEGAFAKVCLFFYCFFVCLLTKK
jgi:hypothetical protein